jgi:hypothetical protein
MPLAAVRVWFSMDLTHLLWERSRPAGGLMLRLQAGSSHCAPGSSRKQRLTCLHWGAAKREIWGSPGTFSDNSVDHCAAPTPEYKQVDVYQTRERGALWVLYPWACQRNTKLARWDQVTTSGYCNVIGPHEAPVPVTQQARWEFQSSLSSLSDWSTTNVPFTLCR